MKIKNRITALYALIALPILSTGHSQTWETADTITYPTAGPSAQVDDIAAAADGTLYAVGSSLNPSGGFDANHVRRSFDGGATWTTVTSFSPVSGNGIDKLAVDSSGRLYAAGFVGGVWTVLRSLDQGASWSTVDTFDTGANPWPLRSMTIDAGGNVYVVGSSVPSRGPRQWLVRKGVPNPSALNGISWVTIDTYTPSKNYGAYATAVATRTPGAGPAEIYVGGTAGSSSGLRGMVRRSADGGATWTTIDSFASDFEGLKTLAVAGDGSIYTSGFIRTVSSSKNNQTITHSFVVRKGLPVPGGFSWSTKETISTTAYPANVFRPQSSTVDQFGRLFLAGHEIVNNDWTWRVRASFDGGQTFEFSDSFAPGVALCVASDSTGNVFAGGYFGTDISNGGGIIRKLAAPAQ